MRDLKNVRIVLFLTTNLLSGWWFLSFYNTGGCTRARTLAWVEHETKYSMRTWEVVEHEVLGDLR